jgi:hypothetical protein
MQRHSCLLGDVLSDELPSVTRLARNDTENLPLETLCELPFLGLVFPRPQVLASHPLIVEPGWRVIMAAPLLGQSCLGGREAIFTHMHVISHYYLTLIST